MSSEQRLWKIVVQGEYARLYLCLRSRAWREWQVSFEEIESVLGFNLPDSARSDRQWWSNSGSQRGHDHTMAWLLAGWKVKSVDLERETLVFECRPNPSGKVQPNGKLPPMNTQLVDLEKVFPPHDLGPWPAGLSLRREDLYDDRGC